MYLWKFWLLEKYSKEKILNSGYIKKRIKMEHIYTINDKKFKYTNLKKELIL